MSGLVVIKVAKMFGWVSFKRRGETIWKKKLELFTQNSTSLKLGNWVSK